MLEWWRWSALLMLAVGATAFGVFFWMSWSWQGYYPWIDDVTDILWIVVWALLGHYAIAQIFNHMPL